MSIIYNDNIRIKSQNLGACARLAVNVLVALATTSLRDLFLRASFAFAILSSALITKTALEVVDEVCMDVLVEAGDDNWCDEADGEVAMTLIIQ